ncbi:MAG: glycosyltransferase family 4 protein [Verrucomicrobia bacterium]|nr:glycosyltransferase family 4 protein [Verrucomicrobiota bacterium]
MKAKICVDARMLFASGIGTYLQSLIPRLEKAFELILLLRNDEEKWAKEHFSSSLIKVAAPIYTLKEQILCPFKIPFCDLFWSPHYNIPLFPILAKKRAVTIHDICHLAMGQFFPRWKRYLASFLLKESVKRSDLVLTVSAFSRKEIMTHIPDLRREIHVLPNGGQKKYGNEKSEEISLDSPFILYVGNNKPHKNIDRLVKAFHLLPPFYDLILVIPEKTNIPLLEHPRIKIFQKISDEKLKFLYKKAELLIHPSLYEGFGLTPLEAMSFGCPVVTSFAASLPEVCGDAAYYVDPYDVDSIYRGMKEVLENKDLAKRLQIAGYKQEKRFSWDKTADRLIELFSREICL